MRILIVDDDIMTRGLIEIIFGKDEAEHEVFIAKNGEEAIEVAQCHQPDVVLMDVRMPRMDGFQALEALKADALTASIPVVLMSAAYTRRRDIERGLTLGAAGYIKKPFSALGLVRTMKGYAEEAKKPGKDPGRL